MSAQFSSEDEILHRYRLEITLNDATPTGKSVCAVLQNPSNAGENVADKSILFLEKIVFTKGLPEVDGVHRLIVVNQFAYSQTNDFDGLPHQIGELNDAAIKAALDESNIFVLAWGFSNRFEERKACILGLLGGSTFKSRPDRNTKFGKQIINLRSPDVRTFGHY